MDLQTITHRLVSRFVQRSNCTRLAMLRTRLLNSYRNHEKCVDCCRHGILILCFRMVLPQISLARTGVCGIDQLRKQFDASVATG